MNICFVSNCQFNEHTGGIDRVCVSLIGEMYSRGHRVVCVYRDESKGNYIQYVINKKLPNGDIPSAENIDFFKKLLIEEDIDIVLDHSYSMSYHRMLFALRKTMDFRLVTIQHGDPFAIVKDFRDRYDFISYSQGGVIKKIYFVMKFFVSYFLRYKSIKQMFLEKYVESDCYVVLSNGFVNKLKKRFNLKEERKLRFIYNPIKSDDVDLNSLNKKNQILFVGRLDYQKRVDRLLYIWKEVYHEHQDWNLVVVGDGEERERLENLAKELHLQNYCFVGSVESREYMKESKICCLLSSYEGFAMVLLEAQMYGCVPIAYNSYETLQEIMPNVDFELKIKPFKKQEYVKCLDRLIIDEDLLLNIKKCGLKNVKRFDVVEIVDQWEGLFKDIEQK